MLPLLAHCDWSTRPSGRWICTAQPLGGKYQVALPEQVGPLPGFFARLRLVFTDGPILAAFDFPIGLPRSYAKNAGTTSFTQALRAFGFNQWTDFYTPAVKRDEISITRPFYPDKPGGTNKQQLADALGVTAPSDLLRVCDRKTPLRPAACETFWILGANQVGRAAICGWRDLLEPAQREDRIVLWPFDGELPDLLASEKIIVAESYPAETYSHLGLDRLFGKTTQAGRTRQARQIFNWCDDHGVILHPVLASEIANGFGDGPHADDPFDSFIGLLGLIEVIQNPLAFAAPADPVIRSVEGWILGMRSY